jgi:hypothetical protein
VTSRERLGGVGVAAALAAAAGLCAFVGLRSGAIPHSGDWDQYVAFFEIQRRALLVHGELPWWNPWLLGGIPGVAHPQFTTLSPYFLPILAFGPVAGTFVFYALHVFTGAAGTWLLARRLGRGAATAAAAAGVFSLAFVPIVAGGVANRMNGSLVPWLIVGLLDARRGARGVAITALATALLLLEGGVYALVGGGLLALLLALCDGVPRAVAQAALRFGAGVLLGVGLAGLRVLPMAELYAAFPRDSGMYAAAPLWDGGRLATLPGAVAALLCARHPGQREWLFGQFLFVGVQLTTALLALLLVGIAAARRRPLLIVAFALPLLLVLGNASPLNLWAALTRLPGFTSLNLPMSMVFVPFLGVALLVADAAPRLVALAGGGERWRSAAAAALALAACALLAFQSAELRRDWPLEQVPDAAPAGTPFTQAAGDKEHMVPSIRRNEGVIVAYEEVVRSKLVIAATRRGERDDHGEWFLQSSGVPLAPNFWSPNRIEFEWKGGDAGGATPRSERLVVNQNVLPGWSATFTAAAGGATRELPVEPYVEPYVEPTIELIEPHAGRLSVALPREPGRLVLRYAPRSLVAGACTSAVALALLLLLATKPARRLLARPDGGRLEGRLSPP